MAVKKTEKIWHNGKFIPWDAATVHVTSHVVSYGSAVFEGIRCYMTGNGPAIFRLRDHMQRLIDSAKIYRMSFAFDADQLSEAAVELVRVNRMGACYVRPIVLRGYGEVGVNPFPSPVEVYIATWEWGKYLGQEAIEKGVDVCVSSWTRMAPNTLPAMSKSAANYMNSQLIRMEAIVNGYAEGIGLDAQGYASEGSGENLFLVKNGTIITPPLSGSILPGITRRTVIQLAADLKIPLVEELIPREMLYLVDEMFFCGTAAEITPIRSVDRIPVGKGERGPITARLQEEFFGITGGKIADRHGWLTPVGVPAGATAR